jgi:SfnB family sulfur acquisition oxidoreductase
VTEPIQRLATGVAAFPSGVLDSTALLRRAEQLGRDLAREASVRDAERRLPYEEMAELSRSGILAARVPRRFGGPEVSFADLSHILLHLAKGDPNVAQAIQPHCCGVEKVRIYGDPNQQKRYFTRVLNGALITNASAERSGAVVGDVATYLAQSSEGLRLVGAKSYCTGSLFADSFYVSALYDGGRALVFVPRDREGVEISEDWNGFGQRTTASGTVLFKDVAIDPGEVMRVTGHGKRRTHEGAVAQILHAAIDAGIALAALDDAVAFGKFQARPVPESRVSKASDDPFVIQAIGEIALAAHGAVALITRAALSLDEAAPIFLSGLPADEELAEASVAVAEARAAADLASLKAGELLFRIGGASATSAALNLDRHWRNARTHTTHDPLAYKIQAVGDYYLNGRLPPISTKI